MYILFTPDAKLLANGRLCDGQGESLTEQNITDMSQYGKAEYWEERYTRDPDPFDWYQRFYQIRDHIVSAILPENRVLNVGAGNSRLSEEMFDEGYETITNIDISQTVTKSMTEKYKEKGPNFKFLQMDVRAMDFTETFDAVIDKGTLDCILCGEGSTTNANKMISEIYRVLSANGVYILVSAGSPQYRNPYLDKPQYDWKIQVVEVPKPTIAAQITQPNTDKDIPNVHYIYTCSKGKKNEVPVPAAEPVVAPAVVPLAKP